jgi:YVTN family beta-propeller protein
MEFRILGPLEVQNDAGALALGGPLPRALLAMLLLHANQPVPVERLTGALWGEDAPLAAGRTLQVYVSRLRKALGERDRLVIGPAGYLLRVLPGELDAECFERRVADGLEAMAAGELERAASELREALSLWRGPALAELASVWLAPAEVARLEERRLVAEEARVEAELGLGRHVELVAELRADVAEHPWRERLHAQLMLALYRSGRQAEALAAYRQARGVLVEQLGVEPGPELRRLQHAILEQDPALDAPARAGAAPSSSPAGAGARRRFALILGLAAVAGLAAFGVSRLAAPNSLERIGEDAVGVIDPDSGRITADYRVGSGPEAVVAGAGSVWVANRLDGTVARIDRGRNEVVTIDVGGEPTGLAYGEGSLWVSDGQGRTVAQIDPGVNKVVQRFEVGNAAHAVTVGYGAVWVASAIDATVVRIDVSSGKVGPPIPVQARPSALATGAGAIWVASDATGRVVRLDPRSGTPLASIPVGNGPSGVVVGAGAVWVANRSDGTVSRIDPDSEVTETVRVGREPRAIAADQDGVWVANAGDGTVVRIDPRSRRVTRAVEVGSSPAALAVVDGAVWTAALGAASAHRGGTVRVSVPASPEPESIDPVALSPLLPLVYDGLVAYRRAGGSAGGTLVADLARELPEPSPDGRTYRFRLRPGIRFSTGAPVRPTDVRASIERMLALMAQWEGFSGYLPVRGAAACSVKRCDLSKAIAIDEVAGTVTIHLSRPDPDFLHKLHIAFVVPAGSPVRLAEAQPPPGTGPYTVKRWDPRGDGLLVRNPHFRIWSPDRPDGYPDQIALRRDPPQAQIGAVDRGAADIASLNSGIARLAPLRTRYGARLHTDPLPQTHYVFLNVLAPPFDDVRVRRALNYAVDRGRIAELLGAPESRQPTCQLLPPGFQGYSPSCPFTANPNPAGTWTGPDIGRARRLIAASGTRGMKVEFWGSREWPRVGRYFRSLLRDLGYRSELRTFDDPHLIIENAAGEPRPRPQLGILGWIADSAGPFTFLKPLISCSGDTNLSRFCDPKIDAQMQQAAVASGPEAIEKWRRVESALAAQAPTVPLANWQDTALTAERVGNYQHHPLWGTLLDQLWVK